MAQIDRGLERFDLATVEAAMARRRVREKKRLVVLNRQRTKIEAELRKLEAAGAGRRAAGKPVRKPNARRLNDISLAEALIRVMAPRKKPIHYKELTDTVVKRGLYRTKSKSLLTTVMVTLKRDKRFRKVEPGMYALKG
jgi:hypothetical protein